MKPAISLLPMTLVCGLSLAASAWGQAGDAGAPAESLDRAFSAEWRDEAAGWTELHWAAALDRPDAVAALVEAGMAPDVRLKDDDVPFGESLHRRLAERGLGDAFEDWDARGETPAMIAAYTNSLSALAELVSRGADIHAVDNNGNTLLHAAAYGNAVDAAQWLVAQGADIRAVDNNGNTPLHAAAWGNAVDAARWLVAQGADIRAVNNGGETPLHAAAWGNAIDAARWLVEQGADIRATDNIGRTPLDAAVANDAVDAARYLVEQGARGSVQ